MIKYIFVIAVAASLGGCAQLQAGLDTLSSPAATGTVANLRGLATAVVCSAPTAELIAQGIEDIAAPSLAAVNTIVYTATTNGCAALQGIAKGAALVPVAQVVK